MSLEPVLSLQRFRSFKELLTLDMASDQFRQMSGMPDTYNTLSVEQLVDLVTKEDKVGTTSTVSDQTKVKGLLGRTASFTIPDNVRKMSLNDAWQLFRNETLDREEALATAGAPAEAVASPSVPVTVAAPAPVTLGDFMDGVGVVRVEEKERSDDGDEEKSFAIPVAPPVRTSGRRRSPRVLADASPPTPPTKTRGQNRGKTQGDSGTGRGQKRSAPEPASEPVPVDPEAEIVEKRMAKNRESARQSRERKLAHIETLRQRVERLKAKNSELKRRLWEKNSKEARKMSARARQLLHRSLSCSLEVAQQDDAQRLSTCPRIS